MSELVALKVKIGLRHGGKKKEADHPNFNQVPDHIRKGLDWSIYVDTFGSGWLYDCACGHQEQDAESPLGMQWGVLLVPEEFAEAAAELFPKQCFLIDETEVEHFYNTRHNVRMSEFDLDEKRLTEIAHLEELERNQTLPAPTADEVERRRRVRDPNHQEAGIRRNRKKYWADRKGLHGWSVKDPAPIAAKIEARRRAANG